MNTLRQAVDEWNETGGTVPETTIYLFRFLYLLTKTRGYKTIVKFMTHEVTDLEPVFEFLSRLDPVTTHLWEVRYICLIWLSLICMIPFDLKKVDSGIQSKDSLVIKMINQCKLYLASTGKERDGAGLLVARLLSRQDLSGEYLKPFLQWTKDRLGSKIDVFEITGILASLCYTYQLVPRAVLLPSLDDIIIPLLTMEFFNDHESNSLIRKLRTKLTQRVGLCYLKPKLAKWRYQRGNRSLKQNLEDADTIMSSSQTLKDGEGGEDDEDDDVPENLETIIEILLNGLRDKDTIVRWSAAKGMGRITQRLPQELAEDVVGSILELFGENTFINKEQALDLSAVSDSTWHGASLAIAELARRGLLLPDRLRETIPWITRGLKFDLKRGSHSIGAHVRDACCYVCWAFARAYAPHILEPFVQEIAHTLVVVSVFDREINVRRASSAAFQENVGRQGIFPHGIEIIQKADYFSVGNRNNAFLNIAIEIAEHTEYRYELIHHLITITAKHWDKPMRILASKTLAKMVPLDPSFFLDKVLPYLIPNAMNTNMQISHGALLAISEIALSLWETEVPEIRSQYQKMHPVLASIISKIPPKSLTTFGSEHVREAACHLITCLSTSQVDPSVSLKDWKKCVAGSLIRKEQNVQEYAVYSFGAIAKMYGVDRKEIEFALSSIKVNNIMIHGRRSYGLALGTIFYDQDRYKPYLHDVLVQLCKATQYQTDPQANDAKAKENAVLGLTNILKNLGAHLKSAITHDEFILITNTLQSCIADYSTDERGDVGSWVRIAAMNLLDHLLPTVSKLDKVYVTDQPYLDRETTTAFIGAIIKQSVERIDRLRSCAGNVLCNIVFSDVCTDFAGRDLLQQLIRKDLTWTVPSDLYPVMVHILQIPEYRVELLTGIIASAGGLTESLVRHSSQCLIDYMDSLPVDSTVDPSLESLFNTLLDIAMKYEKQDRVTVPLMDVIGLLYESGTLIKIENKAPHMKLFTIIRKENFKCKNVPKLLSSIKVYVGLMSIPSQVRVKSLQQMFVYLVHPFPRIRVQVADQLFNQLSIDDEEEDVAEAINIITGTDW
ncbi:armadillo-type protein [Pilobolus umbonatus]|nr:armadillo-type protein [Pilobolus umbonatus]